MNLITLNLDKEEIQMLIYCIDVIKELLNSPYREKYIKSIKGYETALLQIDKIEEKLKSKNG